MTRTNRAVAPRSTIGATAVSSDESWRHWLPDPEPAPVAAVPDQAVARLMVATGPTAPQRTIEPPEHGALPVVSVLDSRPDVWLVGAHGGAGESTLAALDPSWAASGHAWPSLPASRRACCVLVARTHVPGLLAAQSALTQWASSTAGPSVDLLGLALVADAPGRFPPPIRDLMTVVGGGAPRVWTVPWVEAWRLGEDGPESAPRPVIKLAGAIRSLADAATAAPETAHEEN